MATIRLNRPDKLNAFNDQMIEETTAAFRQSGRDQAIRCVVLTGNGRAFSSGQDLSDVTARGDAFSISDHLRHGYHKLITQMVQLEKPIIGAINGNAEAACVLAAQNGFAEMFGEATAEEATLRMTSELMGLRPSDPRHEAALEILRDHVAEVLSVGKTESEALQSGFVLACLSPSVAGVGF